MPPRDNESNTFSKPNRLDYILTMPRVLTKGVFRAMIFTNDHTPAYVHVFDADGQILINLGGE